ncbi:MAG: type II secretion system minor pseudopilin GspJ [Gammaproteobacteria bacterium]|nr:type II secretion system minor pseudopilin GspJ [Gammaproteobacteria bacterium]
MYANRCHSAQGFTLIEMLVALGIFALLGLISSQLLTRIIDVQDAVGARGERLAAIQRAMDLVQRDVLQAANRTVRDELGDELPALRVSPDLPLEVTRLGQRNPLELPRSDAVRVAYAMRDGSLVRLLWSVLDRANDTLPVAQVVLSDVDALEVTVIDSSGNEHAFWPLVGDLAADPDMRLAGIKLEATMQPFGEITRVWDASMFASPPTGPGA